MKAVALNMLPDMSFLIGEKWGHRTRELDNSLWVLLQRSPVAGLHVIWKHMTVTSFVRLVLKIIFIFVTIKNNR